MKTALVNFADAKYASSQDKLNASARRYNIDLIISWRHKDFQQTEFYKHNIEILSQPRGVGYWLWKPYIIQQAIERFSWNDILIYADAGIEITADLSPLIRICQDQADIMLFNNAHYLNRAWTKRDCFILMNCDTADYWNSIQTEGAFQVFKKTNASLHFISQWLQYAKNPNILTDLPNVCNTPNFPEFQDHRHDQSILSLLAVRYDLEIFKNPSRKGVPYKKFFSNSPYGVLLNHHRTKNPVKN